jgi:hypothetical protein
MFRYVMFFSATRYAARQNAQIGSAICASNSEAT